MMAVTSLSLGVVSILSILVLCGMISGLPGLAAVVCGHLAIGQIRSSAVPVGGRGMAISGLIMGYLGLLAQAVWVVFLLMAFSWGNISVGP